jgi:predicted cobalt transporter CbtA
VPLSGYPRILLRGLLAGLIAGVLAGGFAFLFGEPTIDAAIAVEHATAAAHDHGGEPAVGRTAQKGGLILATTLYGVAMGGLLATGYTLLRRRLRTTDDGRAALGLAAAALLGAVLVPFGKYPPNPPAVGNPATIDQRTLSYLAILVIGLVAVWAAVVAFRAPPARAAEWVRATAAAGAFTAVVTTGYAMLPHVDEVPATFPPSLLYTFRITSLGTQVVLWTVLGLAFAALLTRARRPAAVAG